MSMAAQTNESKDSALNLDDVPFAFRMLKLEQAAKWMQMNTDDFAARSKGRKPKIPSAWFNQRVPRFNPLTIIAKLAADAGVEPEVITAMCAAFAFARAQKENYAQSYQANGRPGNTFGARPLRPDAHDGSGALSTPNVQVRAAVLGAETDVERADEAVPVAGRLQDRSVV